MNPDITKTNSKSTQRNTGSIPAFLQSNSIKKNANTKSTFGLPRKKR